MPKNIGRVEISSEQQQKLSVGDTIRLENLISKDGRKYKEIYVCRNIVSGKLHLSTANPDVKNDNTQKLQPAKIKGIHI
jgi:hypothetical protein